MNAKKSLYAALLLWLLLPLQLVAESRNIYVGDIVTLQLTGGEYTAAELESRFRDFEIVGVENTGGGTLLSLRTFVTGEHRVTLGNTEIVIHVHSTLDEIHRDAPFEGSAGVMEPGPLVRWRYVFSAALGVFIVSGGVTLLKKITKKKQQKTLSFIRVTRQV